MFKAERASARGVEIAGAATPAAAAASARERSADVATDARTRRPLTPGELAWAALIPIALAALAALLLLGAPLGRALFPPGTDGLWPPGWWESRGRQEPGEYGRYVLAVLAVLALAGVVLAGSRRPLRLRAGAIRAIVLTSQASVVALVAVGIVGQRSAVSAGIPQPAIFDLGELLAALALVALAALALRRERLAGLFARLAGETPRRRAAGLAVATAFASIWLLECVTTDRIAGDTGQFNWTLNDTVAVLNGRTPLLDYHIIYGKLLPYPAALALALFGSTALVYTLFMALLNLGALLAVYAVLRRIVHSSLLALGLFIPFVAISDVNHTMIMTALWPMRYGGAYLLAWLTARHVDRSGPRHAWVIFFVGGLVIFNNLEFGTAALFGTIAALLCARPPRSARDVLRLGAAVGVGLLGALAVVCVLTLAHGGALPHLGMLREWPRLFTNLGWFSLPMPGTGLHFALFATFAAPLVLAAVRLARRADDVLLTSMLAWAGTFGLLAGSYFVGRSEGQKLFDLLSAAGFPLALMTVVCVRALTARRWRAPTPAELLVLFGFALSICMLNRITLPNQQITRLTASHPAPTYRREIDRWVAQHTHRGARVAIMLPESERIARDVGVDDRSPYGMMNAIVTRSQMRTLLDTLARERVAQIFLPMPGYMLLIEGETAPQQLQALLRAGYVRGASQPGLLELHRAEG